MNPEMNPDKVEMKVRELEPEPLAPSPEATTSTTEREPRPEVRRALQAALARSLRESGRFVVS